MMLLSKKKKKIFSKKEKNLWKIMRNSGIMGLRLKQNDENKKSREDDSHEIKKINSYDNDVMYGTVSGQPVPVVTNQLM